MNRKEDFKVVFVEYLQAADMYPLFDEDKLTIDGEYRHICFMKTYYKDGNETPFRLLVPTSAWQTLLTEVDRIFESKINAKLVHRAIDYIMCDLAEFPLPDEKLNNIGEDIFLILLRNYESRAEALVPLYNLGTHDVFEAPLARAILQSGHSQSILSHKTRHDEMLKSLSKISNHSFLRIQVSGDNESHLAQVELEAEQALKVLRYVTAWQSTIQGNKRVRFNPASFVTIREPGMRRILYHNPEEPDSRPGIFGDREKSLNFSRQDIDTARQYRGLNDLNYHFANSDNSISERVIRALELYDSGTRSLTNWQALYRYVASINVALPTSSSKGTELATHLSTLIKNGGSYVGTMSKDKVGSAPDTITWDEMVAMTAEPFKDFYLLRSKILHGNPMSEEELSDTDVEDARVLAHNAVRLIAHVAREFNWQNYTEAKNWFKSPSFASSIKVSEE